MTAAHRAALERLVGAVACWQDSDAKLQLGALRAALELECDLFKIAVALDMVNWPEGQGGYQRATAAEMVAAIKGMQRE